MHPTRANDNRARAVGSGRRQRRGTRRRDPGGKPEGVSRHGNERRRPARREIDDAALGWLAHHGPQILAIARRYAATPEDAEDAYQRGLKILLRKAPPTARTT